MPGKKLNAQVLWMQFEDVLAPGLGLTVKERAVYCYLLRHSLVIGESRIQFSVTAMGRTLHMGIGAARNAVRRLDELGRCACLDATRTVIPWRCGCPRISARSAGAEMARHSSRRRALG